MRSLIFLLSFFAACSSHAQQFLINARSTNYVNSPVTVTIAKPADRNNYGLYNARTKKNYPLQWTGQHEAMFILDSLAAGQTMSVSLKKYSNGSIPFDFHETDAGLEMRIKEKPVYFYHTAIAEPPADSPAYYKRSGFIHPLYSPDGKIMTDDFPSNHAHQHAIFHAWTNNTFRKQHVDFWNQHQLTGTIQFKDVVSKSGGPVFAELRTRQEYVSLKFGVVLQEEWTVRAYPFTDYFLIDLSLEQTNITTDTLFLNKYIYGGMAFRGSKEWDPFNKKYFRNNWNILTSEGIKDSVANNTAAKWVTAYGNVDGQMSAVTVFNHNTNIRYPQKIRVHPNMPYWVYAPVIDGEMFIPPGGKYIASFRYFIRSAMPDNRLLRRIDENWNYPPEVKMVKAK